MYNHIHDVRKDGQPYMRVNKRAELSLPTFVQDVTVVEAIPKMIISRHTHTHNLTVSL